MDKQPVGQLPDLLSSNNDDEIMVITNDEYNQLKKEKISDLITDFTSTNENNALTKGTDGKMFVTDFGNASNITEGTLPVSVLPDIPKDKLPEIETDDLPDSGITAGTYTYPTDIVVNSKGQVTSITEGQAGANNANQDLSNLGPLGLDKINQSKALETGSVSSDADVYADIQKYAHSTFDKSKFTVVGSPTISDDGFVSNFTTTNYIDTPIQVNKISTNSFKIMCGFIHNAGQGALFSSAISGITERGIALIINDQKLGFFVSSNGISWDVINLKVGTTTLESGVPYISTIIFNGSQYICKLLNLNTNVETTEFIVESTSKIYAGNNYIRLGGHSYWDDLDGSIDLKSFAIWADGVPVFNGNITGTDKINEIEIPYTLSKGGLKYGSKIVDVAYRDRVQALYEQTGEAMYYTIDEQNQNFTLPAGDIYGMITSTRDYSLDKSQITNCILEIPQNIKLELNNGTLTLKKGSVVVVPNGMSGSTPQYTYKTISNDISTSTISNGTDLSILMITPSNGFTANAVGAVSSGATAPSSGQLWYDTAKNLIKTSSNNGESWTIYTGVSLPIGIITRNTGDITSLNQIFNGFGIIGSTIWCDKGVKAFIPNGRNTDGTLNNIEITTSTVKLINRDIPSIGMWHFTLTSNGDIVDWNDYKIVQSYNDITINTCLYYVINENRMYYRTSQGIINENKNCYIGTFYNSEDSSNGRITALNTKLSYRAMDYNDFINNGISNIICTTAPTTVSTASAQRPAVVVENYVNGTSGYYVRSDGYCEQWGYLSSITASGTIIQLLKPYINANYNISFGRSNLRSDLNENIQWKNKTTSQITIFVQAGILNADWRTCGYIK